MKNFNLNFQLLLISKIISIVGGNVLGFALVLFIIEYSESPQTLAIIMAISQIPAIALIPFSGIIADRLNKKWLITFFDLVTTISTMFLLWVLDRGGYGIVILGALRTLKILIATIAGPAFTASVPLIVDEEQLVSANGSIQAISALGMIAGSVLGGVLFSVLGMFTITVISTFLFVISTIIDLFLKIPHEKRPMPSGILKSFVGDIKESYEFLRNEKPLIFQISIISAFLNSSFNPIMQISLPLLASLIFNQNVGISYGLASLGMLLGGIFAGKLKQWLELKTLPIWLAAFAMGGLFLAFSISQGMLDIHVNLSFWLFNLTLFSMMVIASLMGTAVGVTVQKETPNHLLGKVNSLMGLFATILMPLGTLIFGFAKEALDNQSPIVFIGFTLINLLCAFSAYYFIKTNDKIKAPI